MSNGCWYENRVGGEKNKGDRKGDQRSEYEKDLTSIIHSFPFRRLQGKFQMISGNECDFTRNRLTHSLEVATIAKNIYLKLKESGFCKCLKSSNGDVGLSSDDLDTLNVLQCASLLHDIGNPPFGHGGEAALNYMMRDDGGFEGNAQAFHLLTQGKDFFSDEEFNLTSRVLLSILKYPVKYSVANNGTKKKDDGDIFPKNRMLDHKVWDPPKCYYDIDDHIVEKILDNLSDNEKDKFCEVNNKHKTIYKTFDCSVMELADDITNAIHDFEDIIYLKLISFRDVKEKLDRLYNGCSFSDIDEKFKSVVYGNGHTVVGLEQCLEELFTGKTQFKKIIGTFVHYAIQSIEIKEIDGFCSGFPENSSDPAGKINLFRYNVVLTKECTAFLEMLNKIKFDQVIYGNQAQTVVHGGMLVLMQIFEAFQSNPDYFLPKNLSDKCKKCCENRNRIICNFIAGMTDEFAYRMHARLFGHNTRTMFEKI